MSRFDTSEVTIQGIVLAVDASTHRAELKLSDGSAVNIAFSQAQEDQITTALNKHGRVQIRLNGKGKYSTGGTLESMSDVTEIEFLYVGQRPFDEEAEPIWETIIKIAKSLPEDFWDDFPDDLALNHDKYLHGERRPGGK